MSNPCQVLDCPAIPLYEYTLQGELPTPSPPTPASFYNQEVYVVVCEAGDEPVFSGDLPGWISFDSENRRFVGSAGVWGGTSQDQANQIAQAELDAFATEHSGQVLCSGIEFLFSWGAATIDPGDGSASFSPEDTTGNTGIATAEIADPAPGPNPASANNTGSITWNSNSVVPANLHIEVVSTGTDPDPIIVWNMDLVVVAPSSNLVTEDHNSVGLNATVDIPFNLPDTGGADWTINWLIVCVVSPNPTNGGSISLTGTVTIL